MMLFRLLLPLFCLGLLHADTTEEEKSKNQEKTAEATAPKEKGWKKVYLASYFRSGNHWLRYLLEEATHVATSSYYCDGDPQHFHLPSGWGGYFCKNGYEGTCRYPEPGEFVFIKTHYPSFTPNPAPDFLQPAVMTIRIVRNPIDSIYSWHLYSAQGNKVTPTQYIPRDKLVQQVEAWKRFQEFWDQKPNVLNLYYEDILKDPKTKLKLIFEVIGWKISDENIERAVEKYPPRGSYLQHLHGFTQDDLKYMHGELNDLTHKHGYHIPVENAL